MKTEARKIIISVCSTLIIIIGIYFYFTNTENNGNTVLLNKNSCNENSVGVFEYKENLNDPPELITTLILKCNNKTFEGYMFGPYSAQEHGLYYYSSVLENLKIVNNKISFEIPERNFSDKPFTFDNYMEKLSGTSFSRIKLSFDGQIDQNSVNLTCSSEPLECYSGQMNFFKTS